MLDWMRKSWSCSLSRRNFRKGFRLTPPYSQLKVNHTVQHDNAVSAGFVLFFCFCFCKPCVLSLLYYFSYFLTVFGPPEIKRLETKTWALPKHVLSFRWRSTCTLPHMVTFTRARITCESEQVKGIKTQFQNNISSRFFFFKKPSYFYNMNKKLQLATFLWIKSCIGFNKLRMKEIWTTILYDKEMTGGHHLHAR